MRSDFRSLVGGLCLDVRDVVALRAVALGVVADEPELVGDAGGQRAEFGERDGGGGRGAGQFGGPSGGAAEGSQGRRVIGFGGKVFRIRTTPDGMSFAGSADKFARQHT